MSDCIFCKIVDNEIPAHKLYEDDLVLAFLDISPITKGHTLVIPKVHQESISALAPEYQARLIDVSSKIGKTFVRTQEYDGFNLHLNNGQCAGQVVPHVHMHVVPRIGTDGFHWNWRSLEYKENQIEVLITKFNEKFTT
ncbi:MAG: HIT domain-containing protein [Lentisphaerales bacterium]|nr:HIT domain-containing protein [Lentisphaerales bacterium]